MIDIDIILDLISIFAITIIIVIIVIIECKQKKPNEAKKQEVDYLTNQLIRADKSLDYTRGHIQVFTQKGGKENKLDD
jgi:hypothetical protein